MSEEPAGTTSTREQQPANPAALMRHARMSYEDFLEWADEGHYDLVFQGGQGRYDAHSAPGFWLDVAWLWQTPSPVLEDVLLDVAGSDYANYLLEHMRQRGF